MPEEGFQHKLAAILSADVVGYSRLMTEDEIATIRTLSAYRDKISTHVHENRGRVVDRKLLNNQTPSLMNIGRCISESASIWERF
jgi:hypothetical protein